ncbi:ribonuclease inhibitor-like [Carassius auratus]|uniref:Ribonuclease inhibitor-like n=1 Tax=Carassius auratus TaxID=7957 RepID=A0A6P6LHW2_CARAU|nr:ribonuclease inhibitor-like [Carassius auratus]
MGDCKMNLLSTVLRNPHFKLEKLGLRNCGITFEGCAALTSALKSNPGHLRVLDLAGNKLGDCVNLISSVLEDPPCKLQILWLCDCGITDEGCTALASALRSNPSHLRQLGLSGNELTGVGVKLLSDLKDDQHYELKAFFY